MTPIKWCEKKRMSWVDEYFWWVSWLKSKEPKEPEKFNVGVTVASAFLDDGTVITITRKGKVISDKDGYINYSNDRLFEHLNKKWVYADNGVYYNRNCIVSFTTKQRTYWVYGDNSEV